MRVKGYEPDHVGAQRCENEDHLRNVEESEKQQRIRHEAAPDDELSVPAEIQERVRTLAGCFPLPDCQELVGTSSSEPMAL